MAEPTSSARHDRSLLAFGAVLAGGGLYFVLVGLSLAPAPSKLNGPNWIALAVGFDFFATGASVLVRGWLAVPDKQPNLPDDAPTVLVAIQWLAAVAVTASLASIGTWVAFGAGTRQFSMSLPVWGTVAEIIGRTMFGFGAILTWLMAAAFAAAGIKKIFGKRN